MCPQGAELFRVVGQEDGRTENTKLIVAFRNFVKARKKNFVAKFSPHGC